MKPCRVRVGRKMVSSSGAQIGVGMGDLQFVLEICGGTQTAHHHASAAGAGCNPTNRPLNESTSTLGKWAQAARSSSSRSALVKSDDRVGCDPHRHHHSREKLCRTLDQIQMSVGRRIKTAGINGNPLIDHQDPPNWLAWASGLPQCT